MKKLALGFALLAACNGRPRAWEAPLPGEHVHTHGPAVLEIDLGAGAPEAQKGGFLQIPSRHTFDALVATLHQAALRKDLKGLYVSFGAAGLGWARAHEVGEALAKIQKQVPVVCHADAWDNGAYAAAVRGCTVIAMSPGGEVELTGPAATVPYAREFLVDHLKAQVDILQVGKFKGAAEPLTRDGPSEEYRASIEGTLGAIRAAYQKALAIRGVEGLVGTGPYAAQGATSHKLVDLLADKDGAREEAKKRAGVKAVDVVFGPTADARPKIGVTDVLKLIALPNAEASARPHVRLVRLHGEIVLAGESGLLGGQAGIVARKVVERAHALTADPNVKAVVLRIDSPGGSALGSDLAWIALKALRDKKPVIVSIGEMAASGGYYLACTATKIYAEPESIVGSVGVVGGKISIGGTLAQVGIHTAAFGDPRAAQLNSMTQPWDEATRAQLLATMQEIYGLFLQRIAEGRGRPQSSFETAVEGRVFGGEKAKELGLVDEIGGLSDALAAAKAAAGLPAEGAVVVDEASSFFEMLSGPGGGDEALASALAQALGPEPAALERWARAFLAASRGPGFGVVAMLPTPLVLR